MTWACAGALIVIAWPAPATAQMPGTDVWLAPVSATAEGVTIGAGKDVTARAGYDNQPAFLPDGSFLYASGDTTGTDIWRWFPSGGETRRVTATPESEFSPTPLADGSGLCVVRVEADGAQRLWRFDMDGGNPRLVMAEVDSVGYFEWIDAQTLACFVLGEPHTLRIVDVASRRETVVAKDIGRFIRCRPGTREVTFTLRRPDDTHDFVRLPWGAPAPEALVPGVGGQVAVWVGEWLLASAGAEVFAVRPPGGGGWVKVADVREWGAPSVTRLAVSAGENELALVCGE